MDKLKEWLVIVNPNAGAGKCLHDWPVIEKLLDSASFSFHKVFTDRKLHAIILSKNFINKGYKKIIVVGGDGTMNEVINGIFRQKKFETDEITLGMIPVGTGNDWGRMFGISSVYSDAIRTLLQSKTFVQDAGKANYHKNNKIHNRYFVNIAGLGFDAMVVKKANKLKNKGKSNPSLYLLNIFTCLFKYKPSLASIEIDGVGYSKEIFSLSLGICRYNGGGMLRLPNAIPDDGLFDITLIKKIGRIDVMRNIKRLYDGTIIKHPKVETFRGSNIRVTSKSKIFLETDGENLGHSPIEFTLIPGSIKVITAI